MNTLIVILIAFLAALSPQIKTWIDDFKTRRSKKDINIFSDNLLIRGKIQRILVRIRSLVGANRVSLLEYHNSQYSLSGLPFDFCSMTYEDTDDKTKELITTFQRFPVSQVAEMLLRLNDSKHGFTKYSTVNPDESSAYVIKAYGITSSIDFRLGNNVKEGVLSLSWSEEDKRLTSEQIQEVKAEISNINLNLSKIKKNY